MSTYFSQDFEGIAATIGKGPAHVIQYANRFEAAAAWYRLYCRAPKGVHPADTGKRMRQIANAAHKLLKQREVYDYRKAPDGPADVTLLEFLAPAENGGEHATAQIGRVGSGTPTHRRRHSRYCCGGIARVINKRDVKADGVTPASLR